MSNVRFVGLDVHADTIAVAVAEPDGEVRSFGVIPNRLESIRKMVVKLGPAQNLKACYEAGPTGRREETRQRALRRVDLPVACDRARREEGQRQGQQRGGP